MTLHPFLRLRLHVGVPSCCTSLANQPAAVVLCLCSSAYSMSHYLLLPPLKPMQGKIKGSGTTVRAKPCLHMGWRGTRSQRTRAVGDAGNPRESGVRDITIEEINAVSEHTP
jgi:hypothetical protein